jgi:hypothetical protein
MQKQSTPQPPLLPPTTPLKLEMTERERNFCRGPDASKTLQFQDMALDVGEIEFHRMQLDFVR